MHGCWVFDGCRSLYHHYCLLVWFALYCTELCYRERKGECAFPRGLCERRNHLSATTSVMIIWCRVYVALPAAVRTSVTLFILSARQIDRMAVGGHFYGNVDI